MRSHNRTVRSARSQSMVEFALIAPMLLILMFGILDFGRAIYYYLTIQEAVSEGARSAIAYTQPLPTDASVDAAVKEFGVATILANPCRNGPINGTPPPNTGYIYITEPNPPSTVETSQPLPMNAPGGETAAAATGGCSAINPASGNASLQVTIRFNYVPLTPLLSSVVGNSVILTASTVYRTEY